MISKQNLDVIGELFKSSSVTALTLRNKDYQWQIFCDFCVLYDENPIPVQAETLVRYAVFLIVQRNCSVGTVRNYLNCVRRYHKLYL